ncbi:MAG: cytoskeletal protein RodZ [Rickettsiales bacterium]|jgi:cytoskeletal protein RodZ
MLVKELRFLKINIGLAKEFIGNLFPGKEKKIPIKACGENIGEKLRNRRESMQVSIEEISNHLKIKKDYVIFLEKNDIDSLSNKIYLTGFVRGYCSFLKIENEDINQYLKDILGGGYSRNHLINLDYKENQNPSRKYFFNSAIALIVLYLLLMIFEAFNSNNFDLTNLIIQEFNEI